MDVFAWLTATLPAGAVVNALGLGALAILFATDRVSTKGQVTRGKAEVKAAHDAEVANLKAAQERELTELNAHFATLSGVKDAAYADMKASRDYYRTARLEERDRADKVTDQLAESAGELSKLAAHLLAGLSNPKGA